MPGPGTAQKSPVVAPGDFVSAVASLDILTSDLSYDPVVPIPAVVGKMERMILGNV